jgi:hypothetical protein
MYHILVEHMKKVKGRKCKIFIDKVGTCMVR